MAESGMSMSLSVIFGSFWFLNGRFRPRKVGSHIEFRDSFAVQPGWLYDGGSENMFFRFSDIFHGKY